MDRNLALEFVRVTEAAAIAAAHWVGRADGKKADGAAVKEMRLRFNQIDFAGRVVIGEGEKDEAPMLYTGERLGRGTGQVMDIAVDPLEATDSVAFGRTNAISVIAAGPRGSLLSAPDTYMEKIAVGPKAKKVISLNRPVRENLKRVAKALGKKPSDLTVIALDRPRNEKVIKECRRVGARISLITDGDVAAAIATCLPSSGVDILLGIGGSTESVLAAAAVKTLGGELQARFWPRDDKDRKRILQSLRPIKVKNIDHVFRTDELARGKTLTFTATGVIGGPLLSGVRFEKEYIVTHSIVVRGLSGTIRFITTHHHIQNIL